MLRTSLFTVLFGVVLPSAHASNVLVVAPSGAPYTQIQPAIDAAQDGDIVLVKEGSYGTISILDKAVAVVADSGAGVRIHDASIRGLSDGHAVLLHRVQLGALQSTSNALRVTSCAGSVRVQASDLRGGWSRAGLDVVSSADVALTDCVAIGGDGLTAYPFLGLRDGGPGIRAESSRVALYSGESRGGAGLSTCNAGSGGDGWMLGASYGFAADTLFVGGQGGLSIPDGNGIYYPPGSGQGGDGIQVGGWVGLPAHLDTLAIAATPGNGGPGNYVCNCACSLVPCCNADSGAPGSPVLVMPGVNWSTTFAGLPPRLEVNTNPVREQGLITLTFYGQPGELVSLILGDEGGFIPLRSWKGVLLVGQHGPGLAVLVGTIGAGGTLTTSWTIADLGAGVQSRIVHMQSLNRDGAGHYALGNPVDLVELDQAF